MQRNKIMMVAGLALGLALGLTACEGLVPDPCEGALFTYLTAEQQAACEECGDPAGCSADEGEGEPEPDPEPVNGDALCYVDAEFCAVIETVQDHETMPDGLSHKVLKEGDRGMMYPHVASFSEPVISGQYAGRFDVWRARSWTNSGKVTTPETSWHLCQRFDDPYGGAYDGASAYYPAVEYSGPANPAWPLDAECDEELDVDMGQCGISLASVGNDPAYNYPQWMMAQWPAEWTCVCDTDDDCQDGATCSAGYGFEHGSITPRPTLCAWPGAKEGGPGVYGLEAWGDGLTFDGTELIVTGEAFASAWLGAGLWNDAQSFEVGVTRTGQVSVDITECGERSLCAHLGLDADSTLIMGASALIDLEAGEPVDVKVQDAVGSTSTITVIVR